MPNIIVPITKGVGALVAGTIVYDQFKAGFAVGKTRGQDAYLKTITTQHGRQLSTPHTSPNFWNKVQKWWFTMTLDNQTIPGIYTFTGGVKGAIRKFIDLDVLVPLGLATVGILSKSKIGLFAIGALGLIGANKFLNNTGIKNPSGLRNLEM